MSLLQRRHYNHLAEMAEEIDCFLESYKDYCGCSAKVDLQPNVRKIILNYMRRANSNFDEHRFGKASGWYLDK